MTFADHDGVAFRAADVLSEAFVTVVAALGADSPHSRPIPRTEAASFVLAATEGSVATLFSADVGRLLFTDRAFREVRFLLVAKADAVTADISDLLVVDALASGTYSNIPFVKDHLALMTRNLRTLNQSRQLVAECFAVLGWNMCFAKGLSLDVARVDLLACKVAIAVHTFARWAGNTVLRLAVEAVPSTNNACRALAFIT